MDAWADLAFFGRGVQLLKGGLQFCDGVTYYVTKLTGSQLKSAKLGGPRIFISKC